MLHYPLALLELYRIKTMERRRQEFEKGAWIKKKNTDAVVVTDAHLFLDLAALGAEASNRGAFLPRLGH